MDIEDSSVTLAQGKLINFSFDQNRDLAETISFP